MSPPPDRLFSPIRFVQGCLVLPAALRAAPPFPRAGQSVPDDFLGVCVAPSDAPEGDDYLLARLREAGVSHVRLDISYGGLDGPAGRLLHRLLDGSCRVWLHLVQPFAEARLMPAPDALERWSAFAGHLFETFKDRVAVFEVGSTCNRRSWTGYRGLNAFLLAWQAAWRRARQAGVTLAGLNVTDFEPFYNAGLLHILARRGLLPALHSVNLFVERATEPENFDHKILGRRLAACGRFNLVRKARLLQAVGRRFGITRTVCTHVAWSERRIRRLLADAEQKQADYLARYLLIAAASGALDRVYWGPFIGQREGLIDDGTAEYPEPIPHVTFYGRAPGDPARYRIRPAFHAWRWLAGLLPGAQFARRLSACHEVEILEFLSGDRLVHAAWTVNGRAAPLGPIYSPAALGAAACFSRDGARLANPPDVLTEAPVYLVWPRSAGPVEATAPAAPLPDLTVLHPAGRRHQSVRTADWTGFITLPDSLPLHSPEPFRPEALEAAGGRETLRQARNTVWAAPHPLDPSRAVVVKKARAGTPLKRLLSLFRASKGRRSWNASCELVRRGIPTPEPIAFWERPVRHPALQDSYFVCSRAAGRDSVRTAFTAFAAGEPSFQSLPRTAFYESLAVFLLTLHERGVFHRDLSAGNVLAAVENGMPRFQVIDTGRARFYGNPLSVGLRLADLKRICHPLTWPERRQFVGIYLGRLGLTFTPIRRLPFALYDLKHALKRLRKWRPPA